VFVAVSQIHSESISRVASLFSV